MTSHDGISGKLLFLVGNQTVYYGTNTRDYDIEIMQRGISNFCFEQRRNY